MSNVSIRAYTAVKNTIIIILSSTLSDIFVDWNDLWLCERYNARCCHSAVRRRFAWDSVPLFISACALVDNVKRHFYVLLVQVVAYLKK